MKMKMNKNKKEIRHLCFTPGELQVREAGDGEAPCRTITGYAILFNEPSVPLWEDEQSVVREVIDPSAISRELLDGSDIKMTMFHDRQLILARSNRGSGSLSYEIDARGVRFSFDAPQTVDGDKALELVRRGDIAGCSFAFSTCYCDDACVAKESRVVAGRVETLCRVKVITGIYDFTLAADPAYEGTSCEASRRELADWLRVPAAGGGEGGASAADAVAGQLREMRRQSKMKIF